MASEVGVSRGICAGGLASLALICTFYASALRAESVLPEPLTLEFALSLASEAHPDLEQAGAERDLAQARAALAGSNSGINISAQARLRWVGPSDISTDQSRDDHAASLFVRKRLYDFGRTSAAVSAAQADLRAQESRLLDAGTLRRLDIMARFFDVLIADLRYTRDYEAMSIGFVRYDAAQRRQKLGQIADLEVNEIHSRYQDLRGRWYESTAAQRGTRGRLANALNRPGRLPSVLLEPDLKKQPLEAPPLEELQHQALEFNSGLRMARERMSAAAERVRSARAGYLPSLDSEVEVSTYTRDIGSRDQWRASLVLDVPIYTGGKVGAEVEQQLSELRRAQALLAAREMDVTQALLELHGQLAILRVQREEAKVLSEFRDLHLDRSRLLYEQEVRSDLGDAMVYTSEARLRAAETEYAIALTWARLEALVGRSIAAKKMEDPK